LNFAHGYNCGGGFEHSGGSQEEDIFRKTSIFLSLWPHRRSDDGPGVLKRGMWIGDYDEALERKEPFYPHSECGGIYSPHVRVVRDLEGEGNLCDADSCDLLPTFAVLTAAAQNVSFSPPFNPKLLWEKIRTVLWMAASHGHDSVVLGAFGCGYFGNPPEVVAGTFQKLLGPGGEFENVFRLVVFSIVGGNSKHFVARFPLQPPERLPSANRTPTRAQRHEECDACPAVALSRTRSGRAQQIDGHPTVVLRSSAPDGQIICLIPNGTMVTALGSRAGDYVEVKVDVGPETFQGWCKAPNLQFTRDEDEIWTERTRARVQVAI